MAKREWIGEYFLFVEEYAGYKNEWIEHSLSLGKCLGNDEACDKAVIALTREFPCAKVRNVYVCDGWGQIIYM